MVSDHQLSRSKACKFVGLSRSAFYKPKTDWAAKDAPVVDALNAIVAARARWGFWKCFTRMRKDGLPWNHKRVYRVYCDMRLNMKRRTKKRVITRERQTLGGSTQLNQVWALDFMRDTLYDGRPFRTLNVIDEGNREALRIECGTSIPSARLVRTMNQLIEVYGALHAIRMDNGPEMTSDTFTEWAKEKGITLLCIDPVNFCSGVIFKGNTDEYEDGRRRQTLDGQAQSGIGHGNHAGKEHCGRGQSVL